MYHFRIYSLTCCSFAAPPAQVPISHPSHHLALKYKAGLLHLAPTLSIQSHSTSTPTSLARNVDMAGLLPTQAFRQMVSTFKGGGPKATSAAFIQQYGLLCSHHRLSGRDF